MLDGWTPGGRVLRQEWAELFPALRRQYLQTCQGDGRHHALCGQGMLMGPTCHMAAFGDRLMGASET